MGFSHNVCKKAILNTNNEGLDKALDVIFEIKAEEDLLQAKKVPKKASQKAKRLLDFW